MLQRVIEGLVVAILAALAVAAIVGLLKRAGESICVDSREDLPPGVSVEDVRWVLVNRRPADGRPVLVGKIGRSEWRHRHGAEEFVLYWSHEKGERR